MTNNTSTISDFTLERYRLGELPPDVAATVVTHVESDPEVRARLAALTASDEEIRATYPAGVLDLASGQASTDRRPLGARTPRRPRFSYAGIGLAVVCVAGLAMVAGLPLTLPTEETVRIKGGAAVLSVYRRTTSGSEPLADGAAARAGDLVRIAYRASGTRFGVIVSIDGRGVVTRHLPVDDNAAPSLRSGRQVLLDSAYELDDAPKWERFYLITSEKPFDVQLVLDAARRSAPRAGAEPPATLPVPSSFEQSSFLLRKVS